MLTLFLLDHRLLYFKAITSTRNRYKRKWCEKNRWNRMKTNDDDDDDCTSQRKKIVCEVIERVKSHRIKHMSVGVATVFFTDFSQAPDSSWVDKYGNAPSSSSSLSSWVLLLSVFSCYARHNVISMFDCHSMYFNFIIAYIIVYSLALANSQMSIANIRGTG